MTQPGTSPVGSGDNRATDGQSLALDSTVTGSATVVSVSGEIDMVTTDRLRVYLLEQVDSADSTLVVDLNAVTFMGSTGLAVLVELLERSRQAQTALRLVASTREVLRPLEATGLTGLFDTYPELDQALAS